MAEIEIKNINLGGIADSDYVGTENSVAEAVGLDIHSESGVIKVNQKLTKESSTLVDDFVKASVPCSDGNTYHFGSTNGKIWKRTSAGTWSLEATASPSAGAIGILEAKEYQGYIYYAMQSRLGRWQIGTAWSTRNDSWATFTNTDPDWHPMRIISLVLYIGDKHYVAQVDAGTFSANALDIAQPLRIKSLGRMNTDLLIGTFVSDNVTNTEIIRWNTWSVSFSYSDPIPEVGVNAFFETDNNVIVNAGTKGNIYFYNGSSLEEYKKVKGVYTGTKKAYVHPNAVFNFNGMPLFGLSNVSGDPANQGVYSMHRTSRNYPIVLNLEYAISTGNLGSIEIGAICPVSSDQFTVSWKDTNDGTAYGVDILDLTAKSTIAYLVSRVIMIDRASLLNYGLVDACYRLLPDDTSIAVSKKINADTVFGSAIASKTDTKRMLEATTVDINDAVRVQVKTALVASGNDAPELEIVKIGVNT
ncbi:hypothetical protein GW916_01945 [bacterium]|nr:hypothetical protein [bacterium]